jgi:N-acetylneuraminate lyase/4-hydroxy-tetrahydrodipicolinate synthase
MYKPEGIYVAMLTPFSDDGSINEDELRRIVEFLIQSGVHGLFPISSVGEFIHLSREEKIRMMEITVDQNRGRVRITPGVGSSHPAESILLAKKAKELGADGVVVAPPYFFQLSQENIEKYFETISDAVDLPMILYNIPLFTQPLSYDVVKRLSRRQNIIGMKDSSGSMVDFLHFMDKVQSVGEDFSILTGREETMFPCLMIGIYEAWQKGDYVRAKELQFSILPAVRAMFSLPFPLGFKVALEIRGFNMGPPKQPLSDTDRPKFDTARAEIEKILKSILASLKGNAKQ